MAGIFKAYDVRGIYPTELDETTARKIGQAFRNVLDDDDLAFGHRVVVSRDMRPSSVPLAQALIEGLTAAGLDVVDIGLATTPMNYFAIGHLKTAGGVQVTASHNPAQYNGLKFSKHEARPVSGDHGIALLETSVQNNDLPASTRPGTVSTADVSADYAKHVLSFLRRPAGSAGSDTARRLKVVVDASNGMAVVDRAIWDALGIDLVPLYFELDGSFPNHEANPLKLENLRDLQAKVLEVGADLGVSCDGDFDRAAFIDETGEPVGSDLATALIAGELLEREPGKHVTYDLRSSRAVAEWITEHGGMPVRERVGHSFIKATMRGNAGIFGGELAGHYYFRDNFYADCAILAVVEILNLLWQLREEDVRARGAAPALRQEPRDQLRGRGQGGQDARARQRPTPTARSTGWTASPCSSPTGGSTSGRRTPSRSCAWSSRRAPPPSSTSTSPSWWRRSDTPSTTSWISGGGVTPALGDSGPASSEAGHRPRVPERLSAPARRGRRLYSLLYRRGVAGPRAPMGAERGRMRRAQRNASIA